jgi:hypothetical protein
MLNTTVNGKAQQGFGLKAASSHLVTKLYLRTVFLSPMTPVLISHNPYARRPGAMVSGQV